MKNIFTALLIVFSFAANAQAQKIKPTDLPADIFTFIQANFKETVVKTASKETKKKSGLSTYSIVLEDKTELEFKDSGSWKKIDGKGTPIPVSLVPTPFWDYIKKNYPQQEVTKIDKGPQEILVKLVNGTELVFNIHGKFVRVEKVEVIENTDK
ncbi:hypothetical protein FNO01nite_27350 [Flavobacterium noncentrifugens]|uniref:Putative beta-lactamase-inhibitor-like, PepSY-like n=1 Tax=Flavobacterium noncentrifugens TaxID=1128970 RepID=A0A1G9CK32_9FLAO|nr:PepSY-like domain-containing protein [Flavobacterium noncentrifugens]GEP52063.1 hypothetical protein FNO01nite_27350 [Flavobacterium noncentrifugens]SDK51979.1 Putative beta-lactamase-inhibitor-like, PepSY-like [Flavobacterium noncentrifugens]